MAAAAIRVIADTPLIRCHATMPLMIFAAIADISFSAFLSFHYLFLLLRLRCFRQFSDAIAISLSMPLILIFSFGFRAMLMIFADPWFHCHAMLFHAVTPPLIRHYCCRYHADY